MSCRVYVEKIPSRPINLSMAATCSRSPGNERFENPGRSLALSAASSAAFRSGIGYISGGFQPLPWYPKNAIGNKGKGTWHPKLSVRRDPAEPVARDRTGNGLRLRRRGRFVGPVPARRRDG